MSSPASPANPDILAQAADTPLAAASPGSSPLAGPDWRQESARRCSPEIPYRKAQRPTHAAICGQERRNLASPRCYPLRFAFAGAAFALFFAGVAFAVGL